MQYTDPDSSSVVVNDTSEHNVIFIHSKLDDSNLSVSQFRVFAHLSRRAGKGQAYPGVDSIAEVCCLNRTTVMEAIGVLEKRNMLKVERDHGRRNQYVLTKPSQWKPVGLNDQSDKATSRKEGTEESDKPTGPVGNRERKVIHKGNPSKEIQVPDILSSPEFLKEWHGFMDHRRKIKKPMNQRAQELVLATLSKRPPDAVAALQMAMVHAWQGFRWQWFDEINSNGSKPTAKYRTV